MKVVFYADHWDVYAKIIPKEQHVAGKKYAIGIEQNNSNIRHFLARMTRRTKVGLKSAEMVLATLNICWHINENDGFQEKFLSILR